MLLKTLEVLKVIMLPQDRIKELKDKWEYFELKPMRLIKSALPYTIVRR